MTDLNDEWWAEAGMHSFIPMSWRTAATETPLRFLSRILALLVYRAG